MHDITDFEPLNGQPFILPLSVDQNATLTLKSVQPWGVVGPLQTVPRQPFTLVFQADHTGHLPQAIYPLNHPTLGQIELFIVPIGPTSDGWMQYQAVFS